MSRNYDNWERLVEAVLDREKLRQLARLPSFDSTISDISSRFSFDSPSTLKEYGPGLEVPKPFSYNELKKATRNFRPVRLLGEGRSWYDFKGWVDEQTLTAVKPRSGLAISVKLFKDDKQWLSEVNYARQLCHPNLVKLIGYCSEGNTRLSVYEFMPRGSLEMHLLGDSGRREMTWEKRVNVAIGVARGLSFLHDRETAVINREIRASSIFIDGDFNAKLNGFTLAEPEDPSAAAEARGYTIHPNNSLLYQHVAPEYILSGLLTAKSNVYSFGIVLLQLLCGRPTVDLTWFPGLQNLVNWPTPHLEDKKLFQIMDSKLEGKYHRKDAYAVADLARGCLCFDPRIRPSMKEVLAALEHLKLS